MKILINSATNQVVDYGSHVASSLVEYVIERDVDLSIWENYRIFYNVLRGSFEKGDQIGEWTDSTRPVNPISDITGLNTERNRVEYFSLSENAWFYAYPVRLTFPPPILPAMSDDFETGWYVINPFTPIYTELFDTDWYTINNFNSVFTENFDTDWYTINNFNSVFTENFEGVW